MTGTLIYDATLDRLAIKCDDGEVQPLSCGDCIAVERRKIIANGLKTTWAATAATWIQTRVEYSRDKEEWYLSGLYAPGEIPFGLTVKKI